MYVCGVNGPQGCVLVGLTLHYLLLPSNGLSISQRNTQITGANAQIRKIIYLLIPPSHSSASSPPSPTKSTICLIPDEQIVDRAQTGRRGGGGGTHIHLHHWIDVITCLCWVVGWRRGDCRMGTEGEIRGGQIMTSSKAELEESRWGLSPRLVHSSNYCGRKRSFSSFCLTSGLMARPWGRVV